MKYGATSAKLRAAAIAGRSREYQRLAAGSLLRRKPLPGSPMRSRPVTLACADGCAASAWPLRHSGSTKPRLTSTVPPSASCKGVMTQ
ncbi:hypothetical protein D9M69_608610 [compost metagenome]